MDLPTLILQCAMAVHPETVTAIIQQESGGNPFALNNQVTSFYPESRDEAVRLLHQSLRAGRSTDIGLMQVNSQWLRRLGIEAESLLDPCTNIRVGTWILATNYGEAWRRHGAEKPALLAALSMYNTGSESRGMANGYVGKVTARAGVPLAPWTGVAGTTKAQANAVPVVHPRAAPTGFAGTGPKRIDAPPADPLLSHEEASTPEP